MGRKSLKPIRQKGIIKAFYKVAKKEGLENASIAKVATELDVNPSLVMHYFKTKQDMVHGLVEYILERYRLIYVPENGTSDPTDKLRKTIRNLFSRQWARLFDDSVFYSCFSLIFRDAALKVLYKELHDHLRQMLRDALKEARDNEVIEVEDVEKAADLIFIFVEGTYYYLSMVSNKDEYNKRLDHYEKTVLSLIKLKEEPQLLRL